MTSGCKCQNGTCIFTITTNHNLSQPITTAGLSDPIRFLIIYLVCLLSLSSTNLSIYLCAVVSRWTFVHPSVYFLMWLMCLFLCLFVCSSAFMCLSFCFSSSLVLLQILDPTPHRQLKPMKIEEPFGCVCVCVCVCFEASSIAIRSATEILWHNRSCFSLKRIYIFTEQFQQQIRGVMSGTMHLFSPTVFRGYWSTDV